MGEVSFFSGKKKNSFMNMTTLYVHGFLTVGATVQWLYFPLFEEEPFLVGAAMELEIKISISTC